MEDIYDAIIIGTGAAGLSASLYGGRYKMKLLTIGKEFGGETASAGVIHNYPGVPDMDGYELARRLRQAKETASAVLVAVTGYGQPEDKERAVKAGFDHHLVKPVDVSAVQSVLENINKLPDQSVVRNR